MRIANRRPDITAEIEERPRRLHGPSERAPRWLVQYSGTLNAQATSSTAPTIDFGPYSFGDALANTYGFSTYLMDTPGHAEGSFQGRLYGPNGEEFAGSFEIQPHDASGFATGEFAGVAIGKRR